MVARSRSKIAVIGTGGSISTLGRHSLDLFEYAEYGRTVEVDALLALVPELAERFELLPVRYSAITSIGMSVGDWLGMHRAISEVADRHPDITGIVVTHGTSTMEETAYFLHLTLKLDIPVVMVGSQRPPNGLSSDAGLNLVNAARVASCEAARGLGVLVVLNDEVHCAREVTKTSNFRLDTFKTPDLGALGTVDTDGSVNIYRRPTRRHTTETIFDVGRTTELPRVDIVYAHVGADGLLIEAAVRHGSKGIVLAGMPPGRQAPAQHQAMVEAGRSGVLVVQSSRAGAGRVMPRTSDRDGDLVAADNLNPQKARVLAMLGLTVTNDREQIAAMFAQY